MANKNQLVINLGDENIPEKILQEKVVGRIIRQMENEDALWEWVDRWVVAQGKKWLKANKEEVEEMISTRMRKMLEETIKAMEITLEY